MVDIVDIALCVCRLLLYNNFKRGGNVTCHAANIVDKKSRPIKVTLSSTSEKSKVMMKYREKKDQKSQLDYGISSDFTKSETQRYQSLKAELKRREEAGENNWCIRKLQLVKKK